MWLWGSWGSEQLLICKKRDHTSSLAISQGGKLHIFPASFHTSVPFFWRRCPSQATIKISDLWRASKLVIPHKTHQNQWNGHVESILPWESNMWFCDRMWNPAPNCGENFIAQRDFHHPNFPIEQNSEWIVFNTHGHAPCFIFPTPIVFYAVPIWLSLLPGIRTCWAILAFLASNRNQ